MAELAILGGLAATLQLSSSATKLVRALYRFAVDAGAADVEIERFANQARSFSEIIKLAYGTVSCFCKQNAESRLVEYISSHSVLLSIGAEAEAVDAHLWDIHRKVEGLRSRSVLWATIKWSFRKSSIRELSPEMESVKTNMSLLMAIAQCEAAMRSPSRNLQSEVKTLRSLIRSLLRTMSHLRAQLSNRYPHPGIESPGSYTSLDSSQPMHGALTELAQEFAEHSRTERSRFPCQYLDIKHVRLKLMQDSTLRKCLNPPDLGYCLRQAKEPRDHAMLHEILPGGYRTACWDLTHEPSGSKRWPPFQVNNGPLDE